MCAEGALGVDFGVHVGWTWGRSGVGVVTARGRLWLDLASIRCWLGVDPGSTSNRLPSTPATLGFGLRSLRGRAEVDRGSAEVAQALVVLGSTCAD